MNIVVVNETDATELTESPDLAERRCAASPETVAKFIQSGAHVFIEVGAGEQAGFADNQFLDAGAELVSDRAQLLSLADIALYVSRPRQSDLEHLKPGTLIVGHLDPFFQQPLIESLCAKETTTISVEMIPRTTRSQKMDALSSQSNLAGYAMVLNAASELDSILPMMMTPAGTIKPAKVFVIGAGVAGLQAIATAKRLGASVTAFDTRPVVAEQVQSLGAKFLQIDLGNTGQTSQGYANALTAEQIQLQKAGQHKAIAESDIVITTAQLFGRKPPQLVSRADIAAMKNGSVVVDMAAESGGNVEGSVAGKTVVIDGVKVIGRGNWVNQLPKDASNLYANNLFNLVIDYWNKEGAKFELDLEDDILNGCVITHAGEIRSPALCDHYHQQSA